MSNKAEAPKGSSWPMETILLSICLEHGKMFEEILFFPGVSPQFVRQCQNNGTFG
jgi:hypothetical protein